ncbi:MAG: symmetrical bis(5'-nucleosyl)-tetraphosphatase [Gammaproteobacteria bacterium]|nr:symmetrical bis(5'-nucleosyl)-tetraphosphatase [Gammaproteobacteria bacterium]
MAVFAIGDIQGCFDDLQRLLKKIKFNPDADVLWLTGDLVNRGPKSLETLRFVKGLGSRAITVLGNHDLHLLALAAGVKSKKRYKDGLQSVLNAPDRDDLLEWLRSQPLLHHDADLGYTMVHAGLSPQWDLATAENCAREVERILRGDRYVEFLHEMYGNEPSQWSEELDGTARFRFIINCFTRIRFCDAAGRLELAHKGSPDEGPAALLPWFEVPGRKSKNSAIIFGHWSTLGRMKRGNVYALDTGCVWGGELTTLRLDGETRWHCIDCPGAQKPG